MPMKKNESLSHILLEKAPMAITLWEEGVGHTVCNSASLKEKLKIVEPTYRDYDITDEVFAILSELSNLNLPSDINISELSEYILQGDYDEAALLIERLVD